MTAPHIPPAHAGAATVSEAEVEAGARFWSWRDTGSEQHWRDYEHDVRRLLETIGRFRAKRQPIAWRWVSPSATVHLDHQSMPDWYAGNGWTSEPLYGAGT